MTENIAPTITYDFVSAHELRAIAYTATATDLQTRASAFADSSDSIGVSTLIGEHFHECAGQLERAADFLMQGLAEDRPRMAQAYIVQAMALVSEVYPSNRLRLY